MKVLMFGWEFPPHISGGLGTACYGLTRSLGKEDIEVLFVVPKLYGDEPTDRINLINASTVKIKGGFTARQYFPSSSLQSSLSHQQQSSSLPGNQGYSVRQEHGFTYVEVPSGLSAYRSPGFDEESEEIEHWNYGFGKGERKGRKSSNPFKHHEAQADSGITATVESVPQETTFSFSGKYGPDLLLEVDRYARIAEQIASEFDFDVIHAHDWMTYPAGIAAKMVSGKPLVIHVHATEYDRAGEYGDGRVLSIEKFGMEKADKVVTVSEWTKKIAIEKYQVPKEKVNVVHNGIALKKRNRPTFKSPLKDSPIVTFLGRITHQKGPLYFVEAAKKVLEQIPDARFVVAGAGDLMPVMIQRIAQLRMSSRFHFTGFLRGNEVDNIWSMSNVYVMPSVSEPFGIAPLEAIQAGVPVIISKQSGVSEVMPHAIAVDFWNTNELANAICSVLKYKSLYKTLKANSEAEIRNITWDKAAKKLNNLYYELTTTQP